MAPFCYSSPPLELPLKTVHDGSGGGGMSRACGAVGKCARSGYGLSLSKSGSRNGYMHFYSTVNPCDIASCSVICDVVGLFVSNMLRQISNSSSVVTFINKFRC